MKVKKTGYFLGFLMLTAFCRSAAANDIFIIRQNAVMRVRAAPFTILDQAENRFGDITAWAVMPRGGDLVLGNAGGEVFVVDRNNLNNVLERGQFGGGAAVSAIAVQSNNDLVVAVAAEGDGCIWIRRPYKTSDLSYHVAFAEGIPAGDIGVQSDDSLILAHMEAGYLYARNAKLNAHPTAEGFKRLYDKGGVLRVAIADNDDVLVAGGPERAGYLWKFSPELKSDGFVNVENLAPFTHLAVLPAGDVVVGEQSSGYLYQRDGHTLKHKDFVALAKGVAGICAAGGQVAAVCNAGKEGADAGYFYLRGGNVSEARDFASGLGQGLLGLIATEKEVP